MNNKKKWKENSESTMEQLLDSRIDEWFDQGHITIWYYLYGYIIYIRNSTLYEWTLDAITYYINLSQEVRQDW